MEIKKALTIEEIGGAEEGDWILTPEGLGQIMEINGSNIAIAVAKADSALIH